MKQVLKTTGLFGVAFSLAFSPLIYADNQPESTTVPSLIAAEAVPAAPPPTATTSPNTIIWNLKDVDIITLINQVASELGKNFVVDPKVTGKVTFVTDHPLSPEEMYQVFLAILQIHGYLAVTEGNITKIVPESAAKELESLSTKNNDSMTMMVMNVKYVSAVELTRLLKQLVYHVGYVEAYAPSNDIIIADLSDHIARIKEMVKRLDQPTVTTVVTLKYADVDKVATTLKNLLSQDGKGQGSSYGVAVVPDERSNSLLLRGGSIEQRQQIRNLIADLDVPNKRNGAITEVIYLKNLRAQKAASIVSPLIQNYYAQLSDQEKRKMGAGGIDINSSPLQTASTYGSYSSSQQSAPTAVTNNSQTDSSTASAVADFTGMTANEAQSGSVGPYVQWEASTNSLIVTAPLDLLAKIKGIIAKLDISRPQVLIEAVIAEVTDQQVKELGVEMSVGGNVRFLTKFGPLSSLSQIADKGNLGPIGQGATATINRGDQIKLLIRALEHNSDNNILSTPNIVTLDNEPAQIKVGTKVSFSTSQITNTPTGGNPQSFFNREDVGLILTINPQIIPHGKIKLIIQQELSTIIPGSGVGAAGGNPDTTERFIHTTVTAGNNDILVLGGLLQNEWNDVENKVPFLGDIPGVGVLFKSHTLKRKKTNLMVFLRPKILYDEKDNVAVTHDKYEYLRQEQLFADKGAEYPMVTPVLKSLHEQDLPEPFQSGNLAKSQASNRLYKETSGHEF